MAPPRYRTKGLRNGRRGPSAIELSLVLSVIVGLLFVSMRIMSLPDVRVQTGAAAVQTVTTSLAPEASETKTP
jgi:Flp pilus assembly protein TadG